MTKLKTIKASRRGYATLFGKPAAGSTCNITLEEKDRGSALLGIGVEIIDGRACANEWVWLTPKARKALKEAL